MKPRTASARLDALRKRADEGSERAGREVVRLCRKGMVSPYWERKRR